MRILIVAAVFFILLVQCVENRKQNEIKEELFSIEVPPGMSIEERSKNKVVLTFLNEESGSSFISILSKSYKASSEEEQSEIWNKIIELIKKEKTKESLKHGKIIIDGKVWDKVCYQQHLFEQQIFGCYALAVTNDAKYNITYQYPIDQERIFNENLTYVISSFKFSIGNPPAM